MQYQVFFYCIQSKRILTSILFIHLSDFPRRLFNWINKKPHFTFNAFDTHKNEHSLTELFTHFKSQRNEIVEKKKVASPKHDSAVAYLNLIVYFVVVVSRNHQMVVRQNPTAERKYFASIVNRFGGCRTSSNRFLIVIVEFSLATKPSLRNPPYNVQPNEKSYPEKKPARLLHNNLAASCLRELLNIPEPSAVYNFLILTFDYTSHHHRYNREWVSDSFRAMRNEVDFVSRRWTYRRRSAFCTFAPRSLSHSVTLVSGFSYSTICIPHIWQKYSSSIYIHRFEFLRRT